MKKALPILLTLFVLSGCTPYYMQAQDAGFSSHQAAFNSLPDNGLILKVITLENVKVTIVSDRVLFEWDKASAYGSPVVGYATSKNEIFVFGRRVNGKILVNQAVLGYELNHLLNFRNKKIANPDKLGELF